MERPEGIVSMIIWLLCLPVYIPLYYTLLGTQNIQKINRISTVHLWSKGYISCLQVIPLQQLRPWPSKGSKLYMVSFGFSLLWIGGFAFLLVWWTEIAPRAAKSALSWGSVVIWGGSGPLAQVASVIGVWPSDWRFAGKNRFKSL